MDGFNVMDFAIDAGATHTVGDASGPGGADYSGVEYWYDIQCIVATTFGASCAVMYGDAPSTTQTYPAGFILHGRFTDIDLASGAVHANRMMTT